MTTSHTSPQIPPKYLREDELNEECKKLLLTLPKERGWLFSHIYNYQGFWIAPRQLQAVRACQQQFLAQDSDIILVTFPKSGTTWLKALVFALVNRMNYPISGKNHPLLFKNPHDLVPFLELKLYVDGQLPDFSSYTSPRLLSTHLTYGSLPKSVQDSQNKLVYLCRNPRDTFISLFHFANILKIENMGISSIEEMLDLFCKGVSFYGPFWNHVLDYWKESMEKPKKVLFLMYEEMKEQPEIQLKRLAEFLECPFSIEEENCGVVDEILRICSFENLSNLEVNKNENLSTGEKNKAFFRRGEVGDWKNYFTTEMVEKLNHIIEQKFQGSGIRFLYI
ncbi:PREDICTED: cytosolic sulfotransferase 12-like [Nicotiana attenuata]|uniref:Sulfotransferase n=1 Tax=Nicotiana attenuata TaxID=49451 RepID=A0A1J6IL46_NICAT|nr:PREDICTED: cytosolic sulfotransferase 12-like [Nicotiana attenuata]OIS95880.1 cytosolic sulfotransferase 12 [Nicotiana attenuata]